MIEPPVIYDDPTVSSSDPEDWIGWACEWKRACRRCGAELVRISYTTGEPDEWWHARPKPK